MGSSSQLLETVLGWYREPLFLYFPVYSNLIALAAFLIMAAPLTWLAVRNPEWARRYRIQERRLESYDGIILQSVKQLLINFSMVIALSVLAWPVLRFTGIHMGPWPAWYVVLGQVFLFSVLDDFLYYWLHLAMHKNRWLYNMVHRQHHRVTTPISITGNYLHPVEFLLISNMILIGPILFSAHTGTIWIWLIVRQWEAAEQHSGYSFPWNPMHLLPFYDGPAFHDFHHTKFVGNYAGLYSWTDTLRGTLSERYLEWRREGLREAASSRSTTDITSDPHGPESAKVRAKQSDIF